MAKSTVHHESTAAAEVNLLTNVTLYDQDGEPVAVAADSVEKWLARGFSRTPTDLDTLLAEVEAHAGAVVEPWRAYADACRAAGTVDNAAQDTARVALDLLSDACARLHLAIHRQFPMPQADAE